jgi:hypothetical protein
MMGVLHVHMTERYCVVDAAGAGVAAACHDASCLMQPP